MCEHDDARASSILFFDQRDCLCDGGEVRGAREAVLVRPRCGFGLVAKENIAIGEDIP